jgi:hypothetical protein
MSQTAAHLVDRVIPQVPVRQWVLSLPIPLRLLLAAQPELVTPVLQVVQHVVTHHLLDGALLRADEDRGGAVTLIQRFGSAANLNIHLHCLVLDGAVPMVCRCSSKPVRPPTIPVGSRRNSGVPSCASRLRICTDSGGCAMCSRSAALPTLRASATATK